MAFICFVGPYKPIMCGIADYTDFLARQLPHGGWAVLSFDPHAYGGPLTGDGEILGNHIWHGIPGRDGFSASVIERGLNELGGLHDDVVLWFQYEFGIWPDHHRFVTMLKCLKMPKVVTMHTLHFQSSETPSGMRKCEIEMLRDLLPCVDAITVFGYGVWRAVNFAFPEYGDKVYVIKHGIHSYPDVSRMSRMEAKEQLNEFLLYESDLAQETKEALHKQRTFIDPHTFVVGQTGFLCPLKGSEALYDVTDKLRKLIPSRRIAAVRIGTSRDGFQRAYTERLRGQGNSTDKFILETWLPLQMLPVAQRAFDVNFYWPKDCTQSGIVAHALGAGATIVGRDMESTGETFSEAGAATASHLSQLVSKVKAVILNSELTSVIEQQALQYAAEFSWTNQARRHAELANRIREMSDTQSLDHVLEDVVPGALTSYTADILPGKGMGRFSREQSGHGLQYDGNAHYQGVRGAYGG